MNRITNQEFLKELEERLPDFTEEELATFYKITMVNMPNREKVLEFIKTTDSQQVHDFTQKAVQQAEKEKIDKQTQIIKKALGLKDTQKKKQ